MGPVSSANSNRKRVFYDGRNFALRHFCPQSCHLVRFPKLSKLSTKIQTENVFFGKTNSRGLLRQNWAKFSFGTILGPNAPYTQLASEKRCGSGFIKKFQPKTCLLGSTKPRSGTLLPPIVPSIPFGQWNRRGAILYKNLNRKLVIWKNEYERAFQAKLSEVFVQTILPPNTPGSPIRPRKEVCGQFRQKIPAENVFFWMDKTSLRHTFAPNRAI